MIGACLNSGSSCTERRPSFICQCCGQGYCPAKACESAFSCSFQTLLLTAWRAKDGKAGSGGYLLRYSGFPLHPRPACSPSRLSERQSLPIRLPDSHKNFMHPQKWGKAVLKANSNPGLDLSIKFVPAKKQSLQGEAK